jgi:DNA-directed RNA polymerase subunit H (RpoH/RPB5)
MHVLQPNYTKMSNKEVEKLLDDLNISLIQLPKIKVNDPSLPNGCEISDIIKIERVSGGKKTAYYRVVSV